MTTEGQTEVMSKGSMGHCHFCQRGNVKRAQWAIAIFKDEEGATSQGMWTACRKLKKSQKIDYPLESAQGNTAQRELF